MRLNISLGALAILQLLGQLALQIIVLRRVGVGGATDAYVAAQAVPTVLFAVMLMSMQSVWMPRLAVAGSNGIEWHATQRVAQAQACVLFWTPSLILGATSPWWIGVLFPGFDARQHQLALWMIGPFLAAGALNSHAALYVTALRGRDIFVFGEAATAIATLIAACLMAVWVSAQNVVVAAWIMLARALVLCAVLYLKAGRALPEFAGLRRIPDVWQQVKPLMTGSALYKTGPLVDRYWSSLGSAGAMTVLNLAQTAVSALATIIERAVCTPVIPSFGRLVDQRNFTALRHAYRRSVGLVGVLVLSVGVGLLLVRPIWTQLLGWLLNVGASEARQIWLMCVLLLGFLFVAVSGTIAVAVFYAMGNTRTPVKIGIAGFLLGIVLKSLGFLQFGLPGLVAATSFYYLVNMIFFVIFLEREIARKNSIP